MIPPGNYFNHDLDLEKHCLTITGNYVQDIRQTGVKRAVILSSIGAHLEKGSGITRYYHTMESMLNKLADTVRFIFLGNERFAKQRDFYETAC